MSGVDLLWPPFISPILAPFARACRRGPPFMLISTIGLTCREGEWSPVLVAAASRGRIACEDGTGITCGTLELA